MSFLSLSDRLKCPRFGIRQLGGLPLSRLSEQERQITARKGIKYDSDSFLDIQDPDEGHLDNPELNSFQIGKALAVAHRRFDNLSTLITSDGRDPFGIISSYTKDLPIVFEITQDIVDYAGRNPIKHEHVLRFHEFYDVGSVAHDLLLAPDETNKTLIYNHHGDACIAVRHEVLPFFFWHYHGFNVNGITFLIAFKLGAAVRIQDCWNGVDARDPSTWRELKTSDPPHYLIYFYVWRDLSEAQADPDLTGDFKLGITINDYVAKVNGGIWSQNPASSTFFMDGFPSDTPKDVLEDIVRHKFQSDEMECHCAFLLNHKGRAMDETKFYHQNLYSYASVNICLFPMTDSSFIKKCLPDSTLLSLIQGQRSHHRDWLPNECERCWNEPRHIHSYGRCNVLEVSLDDFLAQLYVLVQQNDRCVDPDFIFTRKNIEALLDKVLIEINDQNRGLVYTKMEQNDLVQEFEYEYGFNILCEMGHVTLGSAFPLMVDLTTRPRLNLLPHCGRELSHSLTPPPTTKARLPILIRNGNNVQSVRATSSPRTTTKRSIVFSRNAQKVKDEAVSDEKSSPDNASNANYSSPMATPPPPLSLPKSSTGATYSVRSIFNAEANCISGINGGACYAKTYSPPPPHGGYPAGAPSPNYSGPRQLSHGSDINTITHFLPSSPKKMRKGNGNQKIPEIMEELFDPSLATKSDEVSGTKKRTFSQMMNDSNCSDATNLNHGQGSYSNSSPKDGKELKEEDPQDSLAVVHGSEPKPFTSWYYAESDDENGQVLDVGIDSNLKIKADDQSTQDLDHKIAPNRMESEEEEEDIDLGSNNKDLKHSQPLIIKDLVNSNGLSSNLQKLNDLKISNIIVSDIIPINDNQSLSTPDSKRSNCINSLNYSSTSPSGVEYGAYSGGSSGSDSESAFNMGSGSGNVSCSESELGSKLLILSSGDFRRHGDENDLNEYWKSDDNDGVEE